MKLLIVCGPTATGKTALAVQLAKKLKGELISADSRQVYKGMDIGTGKDLPPKCHPEPSEACLPAGRDLRGDSSPDPVGVRMTIQYGKKDFQLKSFNMNEIPLLMIDVVNPDEEFSVSQYQYLAENVIEDIRNRGKLPIVVGGTGLYIQSLLSPLETSHIPPNKKLRKQLQDLSIEELQERLQNVAPSSWDLMNQSDRQNPRRLVRKIEIAQYYSCHPERRDAMNDASQVEGSRSNIGELWNKNDILLLGLSAPFSDLYKRIDERVEKRVQQGIIQEIEGLLKKGYSWNLPSMNTFGYKEWKEYFQLSAVSRQLSDIQQSIIQRWKWDEHGYARRQMTWFRKMKEITWVDISQDGWEGKVETLVGEWYTEEVSNT